MLTETQSLETDVLFISAYRIPNTDPAIILSVESSRGSPRQISDVFVAMVEGLAAMAEHDPTEPFPDLVQSFKYQGMMLSIMATQRPTPNYRTIVAAVRGLAEYMSISQTFGKKNCRVLIGGEQVALVGLETSSSGGDLRSIGSALFEKTRLRKGNVAVSRT